MSVENSLASFSGIEKVVGSETFTDTLTGRDRRNNWTIDGTNRGAVTFDAGKDIAFENISSAVGGSEDDIFSFISDGVLEGSIDGRGDSNQLDYSQYAASSIDIYPNAVVSNRSTTTQFSDIQDVVGTSSSRDTIQGLRDDDVFVVSADGSISIGGLSVTAIEAVEGNEGKDRLDYSDFGSGITVDLQRGQVNNLRFSSIEDFLSGTFEDTLVGTDADELFEISGVGTASNSSNRIVVSAADPDGNLSFVGFDILNGGAGDNTFSIASAGNPNIRVEGSSDDISSQNRLISDAANAQWQLSGKKNAGRLIGESGTLAEFVQIQNLENIGSGQHRVVFTEPASQMTGSISSGGSSLVLQGDDINIGRDDGTGNAIGGRISGTGELTILPGTSGVGIELGGTDSRGPQLNFTGGELEAIRGGFERVTFGDRTTGSIRFKDDVRLSNSVALRSQADIDLNNHQLLSNGSIETESDRILGNGTISSKNDRVVLSAERDIAVGTVTAGGGRAIDIASRTGGLSVNGELNAGRVGLSASENIAVSGNISTGGGDRNNSVSISSTSGTLQTAGISTNESSQDETNTNSPAGDVDLKARGSIDTGFIDARSDSTASGSIQVETNENFTATGYIPETTLSLATAPSSRIDILYGNPMRMERPFLVGAASANGTVGRARADIEIESGDVLSGQPQGNISVVDRGFRLPEPREQIAPLKVSNPTLEMASSSSGNAVIVDSNSDSEEAIASIENSLGGGFDEYLALPTDGRTQVTTLRNMQQILSDVEQTTETTPALVYVYFVPDAASEEAIKASGDRTAQPDDQLEVMLVTQTGNPIRKRQWGITREQVEAVSREFRQQITSQFSTAQRYLKPAQQLYDWMLRPIAADLTEQHVESLGFVMDTGLRTLPIAALHDGDQYLVENYSLGLLPTFSLTEFQSTSVERVDFETAQVLAMGASKFTDQPDLPAVDAEMAMIANQQWAGDSFLNEEFVLKNLRGQLEKKDYGIVHLATHASFESGDLNNSYIQMWDEKLSLSDVKELGLERSNVGMIVLSACNTALGDRASEYGFAGFAVTSGSQSALASLWPVNDEGTLGFMSQFYGALKQAPVRAEALRRAQRSLIDGEVGIDDGRVYGSDGEAIATLPTLTESGRWNFSHPFFWSAFTMVGNPW